MAKAEVVPSPKKSQATNQQSNQQSNFYAGGGYGFAFWPAHGIHLDGGYKFAEYDLRLGGQFSFIGFDKDISFARMYSVDLSQAYFSGLLAPHLSLGYWDLNFTPDEESAPGGDIVGTYRDRSLFVGFGISSEWHLWRGLSLDMKWVGYNLPFKRVGSSFDIKTYGLTDREQQEIKKRWDNWVRSLPSYSVAMLTLIYDF